MPVILDDQHIKPRNLWRLMASPAIFKETSGQLRVLAVVSDWF
ncbi:hypothetical protein APY04_2386 [Hyphomicrobium sulfonivorans]|uniref:Uncharacterized protein n=1 Tax=Hyphomicrobium sulfonivorans TaxID=121290 RepID=A0A120CUG5_HYPSL|nr:hypothetical protein APY04_2386 [Hyphomicrobium sulfonivorans]